MKQQALPKNIDLFKNTFRASMPLTDDYVFHAVFGRDTEESRAALIEILNIILERKQDPIRAIVIKNPIEIPEREADKERPYNAKRCVRIPALSEKSSGNCASKGTLCI